MVYLGIAFVVVPIVVINSIHDPGDGFYVVGGLMVATGVIALITGIAALMDLAKNSRQSSIKASFAIDFENFPSVANAGIAFHSFPAAGIRFDFYGKHRK